MKRVLLYLVLATFLISCQKIFFNDDVESREISLGSFHALQISGIYNFVLIQDSTNRLVITGRNDINSIEAIIKNDTLSINDNKKMSFNPAKNILELHFSNLGNITCFDPINISNKDTIRADQFIFAAICEIAEVRLVVDCNYFLIVNIPNTLGYFYLSGKANSCSFFNRYGSSMFANKLSCKNAEVYNESVGDVYVNASESIKAYIWGPGNIYYYGTPVVSVEEKRGSGMIIRKN
jgi:hypothetical protein